MFQLSSQPHQYELGIIPYNLVVELNPLAMLIMGAASSCITISCNLCK